MFIAVRELRSLLCGSDGIGCVLIWITHRNRRFGAELAPVRAYMSCAKAAQQAISEGESMSTGNHGTASAA